MRLIGFIKEHNDIENAKEFLNFKKKDSINEHEINDIINYLENGMFLLGWMGYFFDLDDDTPISPDSYYTDGLYVWPAYFPYYLKKYSHCPIENDFLSHISRNNFRIDESKIDNQTKNKLESELSEKLKGR